MSIRYCLLIIACLIAPFCLDNLVYAQDSLPTIYDAAFSSNGLTWGAATSAGFQQYDRKTRKLIYTFPLEQGAKFLKWLPDSNRVLLATWEGNDIPEYSVLNIEQNRILYTFREEIRWFDHQYLYADHYHFTIIPWFIEMHESIYPQPRFLGHTNSLSFSSDGKKIAMITQDGRILIRDGATGNILSSLSLPEYHLNALGFTSGDSILWAGASKMDAYALSNGVTPLLYIDLSSNRILERMDIKGRKFESILVPTQEKLVLSHIMDVREDGQYALGISATVANDARQEDVLFTSIYLIDLQKRETIQTLFTPLKIYSAPRLRSLFTTNSSINTVSIGCGSCYDYIRLSAGCSNITLESLKEDLFYHYKNYLPSQPLSPDGNEFIQIHDKIFVLFDSTTFSYELVPQFSTPINDFPLYESLPSMPSP